MGCNELDVDVDTLKEMLEISSRGEKPFRIDTKKSAEELVREGRDRFL